MDEDNIDSGIRMSVDFGDLESLNLVEVDRGALIRHFVSPVQLEVWGRSGDARVAHHAFDLFCCGSF